MSNTAKIILAAAAASAIALAAVAAPPKVVAHRGFWKTEGSAQNSIASLVKADSVGAFGSEFDVWLTADSNLVVNHNRVFRGVDMPLCRGVEARAVRLDNGENLPSLDQYLAATAQLPRMRAVLELKTEGDTVRENLACRMVSQMLRRYGLENRTDFISFSINACRTFHRLEPGIPVFYLGGDIGPDDLHADGLAGGDYSWRTIQKNPQWIDRAHALGMEINVWTVDDPEVMRQLIDMGADYITTNRPDLLQTVIAESAR